MQNLICKTSNQLSYRQLSIKHCFNAVIRRIDRKQYVAKDEELLAQCGLWESRNRLFEAICKRIKVQ